ncbi:MAG: NrfD/PsrC family molybdoenzyme membrane anchor subunit [Thermoanaerobaculia bacterium]
MPEERDPKEARLEAIRAEAEAAGQVEGAGVHAAGGPVPLPVGEELASSRGRSRSARQARSGQAQGPPLHAPETGAPATAGYRGRPVLKSPVWTWEVGLYFFVGGLAGMAALLAMVNRLTGGDAELTRWALALAAGGAAVSPVLLILDLGRPLRFLNMLRVFKWRSAMSMGVWLLVGFSACAVPAAALAWWPVATGGPPAAGGPAGLLTVLTIGAGFTGSLLATYTGVLLAATVIPVWSSHRWLLPLHFGLAGLGSAAAALELLGFLTPELHAIGIAVALVETAVGARVELRRRAVVDDPLHGGASGWTLRVAGALAGPGALGLRLLGWLPAAAVAFLLGALVSRYGWLMAGRASAEDPAALFAAQAR